MNNKFTSDEKGITLAVLVITIILILILSTVLILSFDDIDVINSTKDNIKTYKTDKESTAKDVEDMVTRLDERNRKETKYKLSDVKPVSPTSEVKPLSTEYTTELEDDQGNIVKVPKDFGIAYDSGENVTDGIVIEYVSPNEDDPMTGNQYVWIPVDQGIKRGNGKELVNISLIRSNFKGTTRTNAEDVIESSDYVSGVCYYEYASNPEGTTYGNTKAKSLNSFISSVSTNKGYYIARYEAGINETTSQYEYANCSDYNSAMTYGTPANRIEVDGSVKPLSKKEVGVWNAVTQPEAAAICQAMYTKEKDGVESDLINSFAWDTAIDFIQKCGAASNSSSYATTQGTSKTDKSKPQTAGTNILNVTKAVDQQCKIFDMAGNVLEWSTETNTNNSGESPCGGRGGDYTTWDTRTRFHGATDTRGKYMGFRALLYL